MATEKLQLKITKHKTDRAGVWDIRVDGNSTDLTICKGEPKEWGDWQEWHLVKGVDDVIMTHRRAGDIIPYIETLLACLGIAEGVKADV